MRSALITGGAGFIGSHLAERLIAEGLDVYVLDNLSTGALSNLDAIRRHPRLHLHEGDVNEEADVVDVVDRADVVFHLAAAVGVKLIVDDPVQTIETNIHGTELVLKRCAREGKPVLLASTSEVYGKGRHKSPTRQSRFGDGAVFSEDDDLVFGATTKPRWSYGCSKAIDEFLALAYYKSRALPVTVMRFFNIVGPRQVGHYGMVVPRFVRQALDGGPITVYGDGEQVRCFCHVDDLVDAVCALARCPHAVGGIFNVGSDVPTTMNQLAEKVRERVKPSAEIVHVPYASAYAEGFEDIRYRVPDLTRLRAMIGFEAKKDLDRILDDVRDYLSA